MITLRKREERGHASYGWLDTWHSFSFADYHDPEHMGFRSLRVINDDTILGGGGFGMHPHRDMEILTFVLQGALAHRDSMGHSAVIKAGDVQRISAGTGIEHSEFNYSPVTPVHLLQIWIRPDTRNAKPSYEERSFAAAPAGQVTLLASRKGRDNSIIIHQDADVLLAKLAGGDTVTHGLQPGRHAWVQVAEGDAQLNGVQLQAGDGAAVSGESQLTLTSSQPAQVLLFDMN